MPTTGTMRYLTIGDSTYEVYNTDTEVIQTYVSASGYTNWRPLVVGYSSNSSETTAPTTTTGTTYTFNTIKVKPSDGIIRFGAAALYNGSYTTTLSADTLTAARTVTVPDKSGVMALTSDIPDVSGYAPLASPTFTGIPTAPTPGQSAGDTEIATVKYVQDAVSGAGTGTVTSVGVANATNGGLIVSGSPITGSGTISVGHSNVLTSAQTTSGIYPIKIDKNGHISEYGSAVSIPTKTSDLTNDSGFISSYTETDPVFSASAAAGITSTDISNWNGKSDTDEKVKTTFTHSDNYYLTGTTSGSTVTGELVASSHAVIKLTSDYVTLALDGDNSYPKQGRIGLRSSTGRLMYIKSEALASSAQTVSFPDKSGTIALTSDIPSISLNGSSTTSASFYAPTTAGTNGYYLKSNGSGAPTWAAAPTIPSNNVTGSGLNNYLATWDGANTLSATSLYTTTSYNTQSDLYGTIKLYIGNTGQVDWRGQLVFHDGSSSKTITITPSNVTTNRTLTLPDKAGTIALTSDIPTIPTVNNATLTIQKNGTNVATFTANASSNATANISVQTIYASTSDPTSGDGVDGDVWFVYEAPAE